MKSVINPSEVFEGASKAEIIDRIQRLVPPGSPEPQDPEILAALKTLTAQLITAYQADGQLESEPFTDVRDRTIHLQASAVNSKIKGKTILVTGGEGCVGAFLIEKLIELGATKIISADKARCQNPGETLPHFNKEGEVTFYAVDIRNWEALKHIFEVEKPEIVFHLAAQRQPGLAEIKIRETVTTSLLGCKHVIQLCEEYGVADCIFSSTGKTSRYFTTEVYAASKKFAEWQFAKAAQAGNVTYGMVRFTHMLENSLFCEQMSKKVEQSKTVNVHAPHRYVTAQNLVEAVHLLLNALVVSVPGKLKIVAVSNLGWPTETLEVALYKILESGKNLPIYFQGLLPGYEEPFFLGQFDWSKPTDIHLLINVLEDPFRIIDDAGDMVTVELAPFSLRVLDGQVSNLENLINTPDLPEVEIKHALVAAEKEVIASSFAWSSPQELLKILQWGVNPKKLQGYGTEIGDYTEIIELLLQGMYGRLNEEVLKGAGITADEFEQLVDSLSTLDSIQAEVGYLRSISRCVRQSVLPAHFTKKKSEPSPVHDAA
ncbi:MAG: polysaccharide biosynthesis protein [Microcoleus sp. PH2017_29_MFU_D_A]|uniref:polysaccharide biosynthesis protein n=1 Tax=unclassified Microcoleus TaxID=2642155 RepID=UPI001E05C7D8|nr:MULTISPECIES: polysaccharide biosynthesis protein [unclassified Microcoleus]MCC3444056.1 polysaccharide biosynthesis protein [Microcoleus sp. PH2017_03_ELD_O_A]MCC3469878.1 polysaccharide biosynthesis protein [Microcoleus sp. PH2017_06_SFM_O_A]MCC3505749.1 polysaccharide biosynthesis protein [Microcoleus sp. PH2017_19_SFW_U_A]TAE44553.1 MAG: NAD-dependent epimerase/dehydratase family protein [Oscillatoriales cyanobacterium]MCC3415371.1 polysaccharide biosynthesis protein [Microcoleus sp. PH